MVQQRLLSTGTQQASFEVKVKRLLTIDQQLQADASKEAQRVNATFQRLLSDLKRQQQQLLKDVESQFKVTRKQVDLRLQTLAVCLSQTFVAMEEGTACRALPDHELLQHYDEVNQDHTTSAKSIEVYLKEPRLCVGVTVQGLDEVKVACNPQQEQLDKVLPSPALQRVPEGTLLFEWGWAGDGDGQFNYPSGICISNGRVFVTDCNNHRVQVFNEQGGFLSKWGSVGKGDGQLKYPRSLCISNDRVFVTDYNNHRVQVFQV